ncbi:MAG TPA: M28 family peptidase, partial [Anaerolineae bacterium]|nr:M28 family peptidase [Anaerolineae bacterium]
MADVTLDYHLADADSVPWGKGTIPLKAHLTPGGAGVLWASFPFETLQGDGVQVLHAAGQEELAGELLHAAEALYPRLARELEIEQPAALSIKLYTSDQEFRAGMSLAFPQVQWARAWTGRDCSLKLRLEGDATADEYRPLLAVQMARHLLHQMGSDSEWLVKGASLYLAGTLDRGVGELNSAQELYKLLGALRKGSPSTLEAMPPDHVLSETEFPVVQAQAWDTVRYLEYTHGREGLLTVLQNEAQGLDLDAALQAAIGQTLAEFEAAWIESLGRAHVPAAWIEVANDFDPERTDEHVAYLASPVLAGRQAGSPGAEAAAAYIADRFADYGLEPVGENGGFFQTFPLTYTQLLAAPRLEIVGLKDQGVEPFAYRQDYLLVPGALGGQGSAAGELIWVLDEEYRDMDLAGKIVLRLPSEAMDVETRRAAEHGASGLILIGPKEKEEEVWAKTVLPPELPAIGAIPVLQLTKGGYERLLEAIGQTHEALLDSPPAQPLGIEVRVEISFSPLESVQTANVLGLLPGSDPDLAQEVIVLGAHYDHVGDDPPGGQGGGLCYPGANDDASGVAVLLEIARLWQAAGYRPGRSVLFAAWGAQELGELGSRYYVEHPLLPLGDTVAMLQLDTVGGGEGYYLEAQGGGAREG